MLKTSDFDFELPAELIAQEPSARRDESRLMIVDRTTGEISHRLFRDIAELIPANDLLVLNTTRVFRARLLGTRDSGAPAEILLLESWGPAMDHHWTAMVRPSAKMKSGRVVHIAPGFDVIVRDPIVPGIRTVQLVLGSGVATESEVAEAIERHGHVPLPPYIERADTPADAERYQTVYANESGSIAAPTAGLHFTPELLAALAAKGVRRADVLLHVGPGTFLPVKTETLESHVMHDEWYRVTAGAAAAVNQTRRAGHKVWGIGTTTVRALESVIDSSHMIQAGSRETNIFLHPPHVIRSVDHLVTNFHLPRSTLLMLVSAFAGLDLMREAYAVAVKERYRFYSYGDAMLIL